MSFDPALLCPLTTDAALRRYNTQIKFSENNLVMAGQFFITLRIWVQLSCWFPALQQNFTGTAKCDLPSSYLLIDVRFQDIPRKIGTLLCAGLGGLHSIPSMLRLSDHYVASSIVALH